MKSRNNWRRSSNCTRSTNKLESGKMTQLLRRNAKSCCFTNLATPSSGKVRSKVQSRISFCVDFCFCWNKRNFFELPEADWSQLQTSKSLCAHVFHDFSRCPSRKIKFVSVCLYKKIKKLEENIFRHGGNVLGIIFSFVFYFSGNKYRDGWSQGPPRLTGSVFPFQRPWIYGV